MGTVGSAIRALLGPQAAAFDPRPGCPQDKQSIDRCDVVFVCVPTPMNGDGSCDASIVEEVVSWVQAPLIVIRSTVVPGTTDRLRAKYNKRIVFQPEYLGETPGHPYANLADRSFIILGGPIEDTSKVADLFKHYYNASVRFHFCDALTAELAKYMENAFLAMKVTFVNEFYEIAKAHGVDFNLLREIWLADPRVNSDHTFVYPDARGFSGKCLPKDVNAIVQASQQRGYDPQLLRAILKINEQFLAMNSEPKDK